MAPRIESSDESDSDVPLGAANGAAKAPNGVTTNGNGKRALSPSAAADPASKPVSKRPKTGDGASSSRKPESKPRAPKRKPVDSDLSSSDEEMPLSQTNPAKQVTALAIPPPASGDVLSAGMPLAGDAAAAASSASLKPPATEAMDEDSDDDVPLKKKAAPKGKAKAKAKATPKGKKVKEPPAESDSDDEPIAKKKRAPARAKAPAKKKKVKTEGSDAESDDAFAASTSTPKEKKTKAPPKKKQKVEAKSEEGSPSKKRKTKKEDEEEEEKFRWWEAEAQGDGTQKWTTLEHGGVLFPPAYEPLPKNVKLHYNGKPVDLPVESEEVAGFFGAMLETDHAKDETFCKNFFKDFLGVLAKHPPLDKTKITDFEKCDFTKMFEYFEAERVRKKGMTAAEKKELKAKKEEAEAKYVTCLLDGRKEKVGNFRAEPPGLFRGRGEHPKKGALKLRLHPEDITINIGDNAPIPEPNVPGKWGKIIHDNTVTWLAHWKENINGNAKYVFLAAGSSLKGQSDMQKFEKARELKKHIAAVRKDYNEKLTSRVTAERQLATALYFIDRLALRAGNEKGEEEADTVGCCSLRYEHVTLKPDNQLVFDFLGKDSIRYYNVVDVEPQIFKNIRIFKGDGKSEGDAIFDRVTTTGINKYLTSYMKGLTAKVFRTYNASITFQQQLDERTPKDGTLLEKLAAYNEANRMVAILCNHQKSVSKNHSASMDKIENSIRAIKYQRRKARYALFTVDKKFKKQKDLAEDESDVDDEWIAKFEDESRDREIEKAKKKFEKENEKRVADGEKPQKEDVLEERIEKINEEYDRLKDERGSTKVEIKGKKTEEQLLAVIEKLDQRIKNEKFKRDDKDKLKEVSLGTSKINYLDPRITTAWCKTHNVPVEKMFNKSLIVKFPWAMEVDEDWKF